MLGVFFIDDKAVHIKRVNFKLTLICESSILKMNNNDEEGL